LEKGSTLRELGVYLGDRSQGNTNVCNLKERNARTAKPHTENLDLNEDISLSRHEGDRQGGNFIKRRWGGKGVQQTDKGVSIRFSQLSGPRGGAERKKEEKQSTLTGSFITTPSKKRVLEGGAGLQSGPGKTNIVVNNRGGGPRQRNQKDWRRQ